MAHAVYLRELIIFTVIFYIVCISHYKSIKSIDNNLYKKIIDANSKQNGKLSTRYTAADKGVIYYRNNSNIIELKMNLKLLLPKQRGEL